MIPIISPRATFEELREETEAAVLRVLASGDYILGEETRAFEEESARYLGVAHSIGVSSGTEALLVALQELKVGPGDEVIAPCFTFIATATVVMRMGAKPVFADIDPATFQMDVACLEEAVTPRTRAIIPVHLYGHPAPLGKYARIAGSQKEPIPIVEDAAQAIGVDLNVGGRRLKAGAAGTWGCFSFYPTKNLPACGEAGLMVTNDAGRAERARQLRAHGQDAPYRHRLLGGNARLDAIQSAVLRVRLRRLEEWNDRRRASAAAYSRLLAESGLVGQGDVRLPPEPGPGETSNWHQYTIRAARRDGLKAHLLARGIHTGVYYPIPLHLQPVFAVLGHRKGDYPEAEKAATEVLSLPVHQHIGADDVEQVVSAITDFYKPQGM
ncbi:MAG TPA: DegT/DnrJ/EryC1/StrS family aminotransferase [Planctomycetota bacterium]|nr:DegT/DnrJ/EryC1/StrS family aminotransferase [Planctomycetota bacterium]